MSRPPGNRRTRRSASLLVGALLLALAGCATTGDDQASEEPSAETSAPEPRPGEEQPDDQRLEPPAVPAEDPPPCADIRAGIDAFNAGDPEKTVRLFEDALPRAEQYVEDEPGRTADLLLAAVEYYVDLPPEEYPSALQSSPEFRRHQVVTLAVCRYGQGPGQEPSDDAVPA